MPLHVRVMIHEDPYNRQSVSMQFAEDIDMFSVRCQIESDLQGKPARDSIKIIIKGKSIGLARGANKLLDILKESALQPDEPYVMHLVVPKEAWTELPTATVASTSSPPIVSPRPSTPMQAGRPNLLAKMLAEHTKRASSPSKKAQAKAPEWAAPWPDIIAKFAALTKLDAFSFKNRLLTAKGYLCARLQSDLQALNLSIESIEDVTEYLASRTIDYDSENDELDEQIEELIRSLGLQYIVDDFVSLASKDVAESHTSQAAVYASAKSGSLTPSKMDKLTKYEIMRKRQAQLSIFESLDLLLIDGALKGMPYNPIHHFNLSYTPRKRAGGLPAAGRFLGPAPVGQLPMPHAQAQAQLPPFDNGGRLMLPNGQADAQALPRPPELDQIQQNQLNQLNQVRARANALAIVVNLDELRRTLIPLFWLAFKLSFLLYIFGRHASYRKRLVLGCMALGWIVWEGWTMRARRAAQGRRMQQQVQQEGQPFQAGGAQWNGLRPGVIIQRARRHVPGAIRNALPAGNGVERRVDLAALNERVGQPAANTDRRRHHHHRERSLLSPSHWINTIAAIGLATEARQMGLTGVRRNAAGELSVTRRPAPFEPPSTLQRWTTTLLIAIVLFLGTLVPEIERKRKRAIEKRDRLVKEVAEIRAKLDAKDDELQKQRIEASQTAENILAARIAEDTHSQPEESTSTSNQADAVVAPNEVPLMEIDDTYEGAAIEADLDLDGDGIHTPPLPVQLEEEGNAAQEADFLERAEENGDGAGQDGAERVLVHDMEQEDQRPPDAVDEVGMILF